MTKMNQFWVEKDGHNQYGPVNLMRLYPIYGILIAPQGSIQFRIGEKSLSLQLTTTVLFIKLPAWRHSISLILCRYICPLEAEIRHVLGEKF